MVVKDRSLIPELQKYLKVPNVSDAHARLSFYGTDLFSKKLFQIEFPKFFNFSQSEVAYETTKGETSNHLKQTSVPYEIKLIHT